MPTPSALLAVLTASEAATEDTALDSHEKRNLMWRENYTNPGMAQSIIGSEFLPYLQCGKRSRQKSSRGDTDLENQPNGNGTYRIYLESEFLDTLPATDSDYENLLPAVDLPGQSLPHLTVVG